MPDAQTPNTKPGNIADLLASHLPQDTRATSENAALNRFRDNRAALQNPPRLNRRRMNAQKALNEQCRHIARLSPTAAKLLQYVKDAGIPVLVDSSTEQGGYYSHHQRIVAIGQITEDRNGNLKKPFEAEIVVGMLAHELRHAMQYGEFTRLGRRFEFVPADRLMLVRYMEADAEAYAIQVLWELKQAGWTNAWDLSKKGYRTYYGAMFDGYEKAVLADPMAQHDGRALAAAFKGWFRSQSIVTMYDQHFANHMRYWAKHSKVAPADQDHVTPRQLRRLGRMDNGRNYFDHLPAEIQNGFKPVIKSKRVIKKVKQITRRTGESQAKLGLFKP